MNYGCQTEEHILEGLSHLLTEPQDEWQVCPSQPSSTEGSRARSGLHHKEQEAHMLLWAGGS